MNLDNWIGRKLYGLKAAQAKRFAEQAADATMDGDIETSMELRKQYHKMLDEANEALDDPWPFIAAYVVYTALAVVAFALAMYLVETVQR